MIKMEKTEIKKRLIPAGMLLPFVCVTSLFFAWGFAHDLTNPMVKAFSKIFRMSVTDGALVQLAFYGGYFVMAFPAALFIRKYSYKRGIVVGLSLYALGALLFIPAAMWGIYYPFLIAYFIMTCGMSFLETTANPYILSMGDESTATRRLNLAQAFNPMGSLLGMYCAMTFIQAKLNPLDTQARALLSPEEFERVKMEDLSVVVGPYAGIGIGIFILLLLALFIRMPDSAGEEKHASLNVRASLRRLVSIRRYREGVITQFFYVGVQIMVWTFIIQYGGNGHFLCQPLHLYFLFAVHISGQVAHDPCHRRRDAYSGCHIFPRHKGIVLPGGSVGLHVAHVSDHLRHSPQRAWR